MNPVKTLVLLRHAKSSWKDASLPDRDRPLNDRGLRDAPRIGGALAELVGTPDLVVSSPAARALATARIVAEAVGFPLEAIDVDERIYGATPAELLKVIRGLDDERNHVILVGHNPGFTELVNALSGPRIDNVPTFVRFDRGRETGRKCGALTERQLRSLLETPPETTACPNSND